MSELLSKEVETIITKHGDAFHHSVIYQEDGPDLDETIRSALRSVLLLAAKEMCIWCAKGQPALQYCKDAPFEHFNHPADRLPCAAAPIHKLMRGDK
jgi:hypothetical protein